jgi:phosphate transport system substrate-binding protein
VAVALLKAKINPADLTADLSQVYVDTDPRSYPLSSYSYMIIPQETTSKFNTEKGKTLSEFAYYFLCEGQQQADALGYSPLPINLVAAGVDQVAKIPGSTGKLKSNNLSSCHNPTVSPDGTNLLAKNAAQPDPCDRKGAGTQCAAGTGGAANKPTPVKGGGGAGGGGAGGGGSSGGGGSGGTDATGSTAGGGGGGPATDGTVAGGGTGAIDPITGEVTAGATSASGSGSSGVSAVPVSVDVANNRRQMVLAMLAAALLLGLIVGPPLVARTMRNREGPQT